MSVPEESTFLQQANARRAEDMQYFSNEKDVSSQNESYPDVVPFSSSPKESHIMPTLQSDLAIDNPYNSKYSEGYLPGMNFEGVLAENQSGLGRLVNGVPRLLGTTATKFITQMGYLSGLMGGGNTGTIGTDWIAGAADNMIAQVGVDWEKQLKEYFPVYKTKDYLNGNVFQQLTTPSYWADDFVDGLAFMAASFGPGVLMSGLGAGAATANAIADMSDVASYGAKAVNVAKIASNLDMIGVTALSTAGEAMFEARDARDQTLANLSKMIDPETGAIYTQEKAKMLAAENAANVFQSNLAVLLMSNAAEAKWFLNGLGINKVTSPFVKTTETLLDGTIRKIEKKGIEKILDNGFVAFAKGAGLGVLTEGFYEENIQQSIQDINHSNRSQFDPDNSIRGFTDIPEEIRLMADLGNPERQKAIMGGALLGLFGGGGGKVGEHLRRKAATEDFITKGTVQNKAFIDPDIYHTEKGYNVTYSKTGTPETGEEFFKQKDGEEKTPISKETYDTDIADNGLVPKDGTAILTVKDKKDATQLDRDKVTNLFKTLGYTQDLQHILDSSVDKDRNDKTIDNLVKSSLFTQWMLWHINAQNYDGAIAQIEKWGKLSNDDFIGLGYLNTDDKADIPALVEMYKKRAKSLKNISDSMITGMIKPRKIAKKDWTNFMNYKITLAKMIEDTQAMHDDARNRLDEVRSKDPKSNAILASIDKDIAKYESNQQAITGDLLKNNITYEQYHEKVEENKVLKESILQRKRDLNATLEMPIPEDMSKTDLIGSIYELQVRYHEQVLGHIEGAIDSLKKEWTDTSHVKQGYNNYQKYLASNKSQNVKKVEIGKDVDFGLVKNYIDGMFKREKFNRSIDIAKGKLLSDYIAAKLANNDSMIDTGTDLLEAFDKGYKVSEKDYDAIISGLEQYQTDLDNAPQGAEILEASSPEQWKEWGIENAPGIIEESKRLKALNQTAKDIINQLDGKKDRMILKDVSMDDDAIRRDVIEKTYLPIITTHLYQILNTNSFLSDDILTKDIETLEGLNSIVGDLDIGGKRISELHKYMSKYSTPMTLSEEIKVYLDEYTTAKKISDDRRQEEYLLQKRTIEHHVKSFMKAMQLDKTDGVYMKFIKDPKHLEYLIKHLEKGGDMFTIDLVLELLKFNDATQITKDTLASRQKELTAKWKDVIAKAIPNLSPQARDLFHEYNGTYTINTFMQLIKRIHDSGDIKEGGPLSVFLKYKDFVKAQDAVDALPAGTEKTNLNEIFDIVSQLSIHEKIQEELVHDLTVQEKYENLARVNSTRSGDFFAYTDEQELGITDLVRFLNSTPKSEYDNFIIQSGFTGTGKTSVVIRWLLNLSTLSREEIQVTAALPRAQEIIMDLAGKKGTNNIDFNNIVKDLEDRLDTKLLIVDETNAALEDDIANFMSSMLKYNKKRNDNGQEAVKVILLGDPKQISGRRSGVASTGESVLDNYKSIPVIKNGEQVQRIDFSKINRSRQLISIYRSFVQAVNIFGDYFNDSKDDMSKRIIKAETNTLDPTINIPLFGVGVSKGIFIDNVINIFNSRGTMDTTGKFIFSDTRKRIVVTNDENLTEYNKKLAPYGITAVNIDNAAGDTCDEVYIDITKRPNENNIDYNKAIYTAIGRAKRYVYIKGFKVELTVSDNFEKEYKAYNDIISDHNHAILDRLEEVNDYMKEVHGQTIEHDPPNGPGIIDDDDNVGGGTTIPSDAEKGVAAFLEELEARLNELQKDPKDNEDEISALKEEIDYIKTHMEGNYFLPDFDETYTTEDKRYIVDPNTEHKLVYPTFIHNYHEQLQEVKMAVGSKAYYVYDTYVDRNTKKTENRISIYVELPKGGNVYTAAKGNKIYRHAGVFSLSDSDVKGYEKEFGVMRQALNGQGRSAHVVYTAKILDSDNNVVELPDLEGLTPSKGVFLSGTLKMATREYYRYRHLDDNGKRIKIKTDPTGQETAKIIAAGLKTTIRPGSVESVIMVNNAARREEEAGRFPYINTGVLKDNFKGRTIQVISFIDDKTGKKIWRFALLENRKLRKTDKEVQAIREWMNTVRDLELNLARVFNTDKIRLGTKVFKEIAYALRLIDQIDERGYTDPIAKEKELYNTIAKEINIAINNQGYTGTSVKNIFETKDQQIGYRYDIDRGSAITISYPNIGQAMVGMLNDILVYNGKNNSTGTVQYMFEQIAGSNLFLNDIVLRNELHIEREGPNGKYDVVKPNNPKVLVGLPGKFHDISSNKISSRLLESYLKMMEKDGFDLHNLSDELKYVLQSAIRAHEGMITLDNLESAFGDAAFDENGESIANNGVGARFNMVQPNSLQPIDPNDTYSNLTEVIPSQVVISLSDKASVSTPAMQAIAAGALQTSSVKRSPPKQVGKKVLDQDSLNISLVDAIKMYMRNWRGKLRLLDLTNVNEYFKDKRSEQSQLSDSLIMLSNILSSDKYSDDLVKEFQDKIDTFAEILDAHLKPTQKRRDDIVTSTVAAKTAMDLIKRDLTKEQKEDIIGSLKEVVKNNIKCGGKA